MGTQDDGEFLPGFLEQEASEEARKRAEGREKALAVHQESLLTCWPQWAGPALGGLIQVHLPVVWSITHGQPRYHYMAPAWIDAISDDGNTYEVVVRYPADNPCAALYNDERLRLDFTEIWAPVHVFRPNPSPCFRTFSPCFVPSPRASAVAVLSAS